MNAENPRLSVVVPAYNEAARIADPLRRMAAFLAARAESFEIIVVDDGSRDPTFRVVRETAADLAAPVHVLRYEPNRGKGYALKVGIGAARGERILFTDADLSTPIEDAEALLAALAEGADLAIGSRRLPGSVIAVHQPWHRELMGSVFTRIVRWLVADVSDVTCGFKAFRGDVGRDLFSRVRVYDWSFDAEVLLLARRRGCRLAEVPVRWEDRAGTKVSLLRDTLRSLWGLLRITANDRAGRYRRPHAIDPRAQRWSAGGEPVGAAR